MCDKSDWSQNMSHKISFRKWLQKFRNGNLGTEDDARSERPNVAVTDEIVKKSTK